MIKAARREARGSEPSKNSSTIGCELTAVTAVASMRAEAVSPTLSPLSPVTGSDSTADMHVLCSHAITPSTQLSDSFQQLPHSATPPITAGRFSDRHITASDEQARCTVGFLSVCPPIMQHDSFVAHPSPGHQNRV